MKPEGWIFMITAWTVILTALFLCLRKILQKGNKF